MEDDYRKIENPAFLESMGRIILQRLASIGLFGAFFVLATIRTVLDLVGWSTAPDDVGVAVTRLDQFFQWLISVPWWLPWSCALAATFWLMWVSWPREKTTPQPKDQSLSELAQECLSLSKEMLIADPNSRAYEHFRALVTPIFHQLWQHRVAFPIYDDEKNDDENAVSAATFLAAVGQYLKHGNLEEAKRYADEIIKRGILKRQSRLDTEVEKRP